MHGRHEHQDRHQGRTADRAPGRRAFDEGGWGPPGWGGFGRGGPRGRGRGRARRGDVRAEVLALLAERPMHGYEIIGELAERTNGMWKPSPGSVYPTLQMLEDEGLVTGEEQEGKRRFSLTDEGRAKVAEQGDTPPWEQFAQGVEPELLELRNAVGQTGMAVRQSATAGTTEQRRRAVEILTEARKKLYGILAED